MALTRYTKIKLTNDRVEQSTGTTLNLSGETIFDSGSTLSILPNAATGKVLTSNTGGTATWQYPDASLKLIINQTSHGFDLLDVVGYSGTTYNKPIADGNYEGEVIGIATRIIDANNFEVTQSGYIDTFTGLTQATTYFLSDTTAGELITGQTEVVGHVVKPVLFADSTTSGWVIPFIGTIVTSGGTGGGITFEAIGDGINVYKQTVGDTAQLRGILGSGDTTVSLSGDTILVYSDSITELDLGVTTATTTATITNSGGDDAILSGATTTYAGLVTTENQLWDGVKCAPTFSATTLCGGGEGINIGNISGCIIGTTTDGILTTLPSDTYDNYNCWVLKSSSGDTGQAITTGQDVCFIAGDNITLSRTDRAVTICAADNSYTLISEGEIINPLSTDGRLISGERLNYWAKECGFLDEVNLSVSGTTTTMTIINSGGDDAVLSGATTVAAGLVTTGNQIWGGIKSFINGIATCGLTFTDGSEGLGKILISDNNGIASWSDFPSSVTTFTGLTDTPTGYISENYVRVNSGGDALEYRTPSQVLVDIGGLSTVSGDTRYVNITGDTMTGTLNVSGGSLNTDVDYQISGISTIRIPDFNSIVVGQYALNTGTTGTYNISIGASSMASNTSGSQNTAIGSYALWSNTEGFGNTAIGTALIYNTIGNENTAIGSGSLYYNTCGNYNTGVGGSTLGFVTSGSCNTGVGIGALYCTNGTSNTAIGMYSSRFNLDGSFNVAIGVGALDAPTTGSQNVAIGSYAGSEKTGGNCNVLIGVQAGDCNASGSGNVFIGHNAGLTNTSSNTLLIANSSTNNILCGDFTSKLLTTGGALKVTTITGATTNTNKYLVSDSGEIKFRTNSELLSDISGISTTCFNSYTGTSAPILNGAITGATNIGTGSQIYSGTTNRVLQLRTLIGSGDTTVSTVGNEIRIYTNIPATTYGTLNTTCTTALSTNASESFANAICLHKIAKTGTYSDLIGTPTIGNGILTVSGGTLLTGTGTFCANQTGNTTINVCHSAITTNSGTTAQTPSFGGTFTAIDSVTTNSGHLTCYRVKTITLPTPTAPSDATICISAGTGLTTGGDFTLNQAGNETISLAHDTYTPRNVSATSANVISCVVSDGLGHVTNVLCRTLSPSDIGALSASTFNTYTGDTSIILNAAITGGTNGIGHTGRNVCLGGTLSNATSILGGGNALCLGTSASKLSTLSVNTTSNVSITSGGLLISSSGATFTDLSATPQGIKYATDYSSTYDTRSLVDKGYVDAVATGLQPHEAVKAATTTNITLSGAQSIDGISIVAGDRVLVKNQSTASQNGIYVVAAGAWSRAADFNNDPTGFEVKSGDIVPVISGTTNASSIWILTTPDPITVGTTSLEFTLFSKVLGVTAGAGITVTPSGTNQEISINLATNSGLNTTSGLSIDGSIAGSGLTWNTGVLCVNASSGGVTGIPVRFDSSCNLVVNSTDINTSLGSPITGATNIGTGSQIFSGTTNKSLQLRTLIGSGDTTVSTVGNEIRVYTNIPAATYGNLNTTCTTALSTNASESFANAICLHRVSKTGCYSHLSGTPIIGDGSICVSASTLLSGGGSFTVNQTGASTINVCHSAITTTCTTTGHTTNYGESFTVVDEICTNNGHVTGYREKTVTMPDFKIEYCAALTALVYTQ